MVAAFLLPLLFLASVFLPVKWTLQVYSAISETKKALT